MQHIDVGCVHRVHRAAHDPTRGTRPDGDLSPLETTPETDERLCFEFRDSRDSRERGARRPRRPARGARPRPSFTLSMVNLVIARHVTTHVHAHVTCAYVHTHVHVHAHVHHMQHAHMHTHIYMHTGMVLVLVLHKKPIFHVYYLRYSSTEHAQ